MDEAEDFDITFTIDEPIASSESKYRLLCFPAVKEHTIDVFEFKPFQSYQKFGPLTIESFSEYEFYCVETDELYQRIDTHTSLESISAVNEV
jgi:hypothetical protein